MVVAFWPAALVESYLQVFEFLGIEIPLKLIVQVLDTHLFIDGIVFYLFLVWISEVLILTLCYIKILLFSDPSGLPSRISLILAIEGINLGSWIKANLWIDWLTHAKRKHKRVLPKWIIIRNVRWISVQNPQKWLLGNIWVISSYQYEESIACKCQKHEKYDYGKQASHGSCECLFSLVCQFNRLTEHIKGRQSLLALGAALGLYC